MENPMHEIVTFKKRPRFESKGRNGFIRTTGVSVLAYGGEGDEHEDRTVTLEPVNSRGDVSGACRLALALNDVPAVVDALQAAKHEQTHDDLSDCTLPTECEEVADNFPLPTRPLTFDEALAIVWQMMPDESEAVLSNVAERLMDRSHAAHFSNEG
jgi:hypothetical protein